MKILSAITKKIVAYAGVLLYICASAPAHAADEAGDAYDPVWLETVDAIRAPADSFRFEATINSPEKTKMEIEVMIRDRVNSLVRYTAPDVLKDWVLLFVEEKMWLYIPEYKRPLRIYPRQRMLGGVATADIARLVYGIDYAVSDIKRLAAIDSKPQYRLVLEAIGEGEGAAYSRIELDALGEEMRLIKATSFSNDGRRVKTMYFDEYERILGKMRPLLMHVENHLEGDSETLVRFDNFEVIDAPAEWFKPSYMKKLALLPPGGMGRELGTR